MHSKLFLVPVAVLTFLINSNATAIAQQATGVKEPYSLSVQTSRGVSGIEFFIIIRSVDPQRYPLPISIKQLVVDPYDGPKLRLDKYTRENIALTDGHFSFTLPGYDKCAGFNVRAHAKFDGWHDEQLENDCHVFSKPNLRIDRIDAPDQVFINVPFSVKVTIREIKGDTDAKTTVSLYEDGKLLGSVPDVQVLGGKSAEVLLSNITASTAGKHTYTVKISNTDPPEYDVSNNTRTFNVTVLAKPDLRVERIDAPDKVFRDVPFDFDAFIRESGKSSDATATVSLYAVVNGVSKMVSSVARVEVHAGSLERVRFRGITASTNGQQTYRVTISNANPPESDETNNSSDITIRVLLKPDLSIESATAVSPVFVNSPFDIDVVVRELNNNESGATAMVSLYEGRDMQAPPRRVTLAPGGTEHAIFENVTERSGGAHTYTIKLTDVDPYDANDANNSKTLTLNVVLRPDLKVENVTFPASVSVKVPFSVVAVVREIDKQTGATASATLIEDHKTIATVPSFTVPKNSTEGITFSDIKATDAGTHWYTIKISGADPAESDITNNTYNFSISAVAGPDLRFSGGITATPSSVQPNTTVKVSATVKEYLGVKVNAATVTLLDNGTPVSTKVIGPVAPGGTADVDISVTPSLTGDHTYSMQISGSVPPEADVTNNTSSTVKVTVVGVPDLVVAVSGPGSVTQGSSIDITATISNTGGQTVTSAMVTMYEIFAGSQPDVQVGAVQTINNLVAGGTKTLTFAVMNASVGSHTYKVVVSGAVPTESTENNNSGTVTVAAIPEISSTVKLPLVFDYQYTRSANWTRKTIYPTKKPSDTLSSLIYDAITESSLLSADLSAGYLPQVPSAIDVVHWKITTAGGNVFDEAYSFSPGATSYELIDNYSLQHLAKNLTLGVTVDKGGQTISIDFNQGGYAGTTKELYEGGTWDIKEDGDPASILNVAGSFVDIEISLQRGSVLWSGAGHMVVGSLVTDPPGQPTVDRWGSDGETNGQSWYYTSYMEVSHAYSENVLGGFHSDVRKDEESMSAVQIPIVFDLAQNYPNPFNPSTTIQFSLPKAEFVTLSIYDMLGREVSTLISKEYPAGIHNVNWNASSLPSGMYIYRLRAGEFLAQKKLILVK